MSQFEERANIRFMCRWGKSASETLSALQQVYGDTTLKKSAVYDWFAGFKNGQETLEDYQRSRRPSTSRTEEMIEKVRQMIQCDRRTTIVEWNKKLASLTDPLMRFCPTIWRWDVSVRSLFRGSWPRIRWNVAWCSLEICLWKVRRTQRCGVVGVRLRPGDEDAVSIVAHSVVSPTKNFTPRQIQGKIAAHCIFWHRRCGTPWVRTAWTYC